MFRKVRKLSKGGHLDQTMRNLAEGGCERRLYKGKWVQSSCQYQCVTLHAKVLLQLSIIHAAGNERPCHPFSLISILQPFDMRNQRAMAPAEILWTWVSVYVCMFECPPLPETVCHPAL